MDCSVIIPLYNGKEHIEECLDSVYGQATDFSYEIIVVDDGSTDSGAALVERNYPDVLLYKKLNGGPGSARNAAARHAVSEILVFLDADDLMLPGRLQHQVEFMKSHPEIALTFGNRQLQHHPERDLNREHTICADEDSYVMVDNAYVRLLRDDCYVQNPTTAVRKSVYEEIGGQREDIYVAEDFAMYCAITRLYPVAASNRFLTWYRQDHDDHLMKSSHTYLGMPAVIKSNLDRHSHELDMQTVNAARSRLCHFVDVLIRYHWSVSGQKKVLKTCEYYSDYLTKGFRIKWALLSFIPPVFPGLARKLLHHGVETHR